MNIAEFRQAIRETVGRSLRFATVQRVHGDRIDVRAGGSAKLLRGLEVVGGVDGLLPGDTVLLTVASGRVYAESVKARSGSREVVYGVKSGDGGGGAGLVVHDIAGPLHTAAGLEVGWVLRATGATTFQWMALLSSDLGDLVFLNRILRLSTAREEIIQYAGTAAGMAEAIAAAEANDVYWLPNRTITGNYALPASTDWIGAHRHRARLSGQITLGEDTAIINLSVVRSADDADDLKGVIAPESGDGYIISCRISVTQSGAGGAYAANVEGNGNLEIDETQLLSVSVGGEGFAVYHAGGAAAGNSYQYGGRGYGSEDYTNA